MKRVSEKQRERNKGKSQDTERLHRLFKEIWDEREDEEGYCYCFESGRPLHGSKFRSNTCCYDHVLEKGTGSFPEYAFKKENIVILDPEVHYQKGRDIDKCPKVKAYREELLILHQNGSL